MKYSAILLIFVITSAIAQTETDSLKIKDLKFDITGGFISQQFNKNADGKVEFIAPDYLSIRRPTEPALANTWGLSNNQNITDNPLGHGPMYMRFHSWYSPTKDLEIYGSLEIDHRGFSWGAYNTDNIAILPRMYAKYSNTRVLRNKTDFLRFFGKVGYFEDFRNYEGLTLYNLDLQGIEGGIQYNHLQFKVSQFGDLIRGYGLGIDGVIDYQISLVGLGNPKGWNADIKLGTQKMIGFPATGGDQHLYSFSSALYKNETRIYAELGYRNTEFQTPLNIAFVAGFSNKYSKNKFSSDLKLEYRYYGGGFNYQFKNEAATHFRDPERSAGSNFIGDVIYPLSFFGRQFSQWAVFTEYDKQWIQGASLFGNVNYKFGKSFSLFSDVDFNLIIAEGEKPFLYPFYNAGLKASIVKNTFVSISITNRTMNLDKHYTTYYLTSTPGFQFELKRKF